MIYQFDTIGTNKTFHLSIVAPSDNASDSAPIYLSQPDGQLPVFVGMLYLHLNHWGDGLNHARVNLSRTEAELSDGKHKDEVIIYAPSQVQSARKRYGKAPVVFIPGNVGETFNLRISTLQGKAEIQAECKIAYAQVDEEGLWDVTIEGVLSVVETAPA